MSAQNHLGPHFLNSLEDLLESHLEDEHFGVNELAKEMGISRSQLHRKLQKISGQSSSQFIREFRLKKALKMLQDDEVTASEIAYRVGFNSATYFNTCFKDYFGFTPGEAKFKSKENIDIEKQVAKAPTKKKLYSLITIGILVVILAFAGAKFLGNKNKIPEKEKSLTVSAVKNPEKTIAVLPFESLSHLEENKFFTEGIRQDIMDNLSKIDELVVRSQQSVSQFMEEKISNKELVEKLDVDYLVGGSVQRINDRVKIRVHLTDTRQDIQLWSEDFDRQYADVFILEGEISRLIATELQLLISPLDMELFEKVPTDNLEAFNYYNRARYYSCHMEEDGYNMMEMNLNKSIQLDPEFALGYSDLAEIYLWKSWPTPSYDELVKGKQFALKAIEIDPDLSEPHRVLGWYYLNYGWDWKRVEEEFEKSIQLNPSNYLAYCMYAQYVHYTLGDFDRARDLLNRAKLIFPNSYYAHILSAEFYLEMGNFDSALDAATTAELISPDDLWSYWVKFKIYSTMQEDEEAVKMLEESWNMYTEYQSNVAPMKAAFEENGIHGVYQWINDSDIHNSNSDAFHHNAYWIAEKFAILGQNEKALHWLKIAVENKNADIFKTKYNGCFKKMRKDPRFLNLLKELHLGDYKPFKT